MLPSPAPLLPLSQNSDLGRWPDRSLAKMSKVIIGVDLNCRLCSKEIKKIICKIQGPCGIQAIAYDDVKNTVTLSGSFDAERLKKNIAYLAKDRVKISFKEEEKKQEKGKEGSKPAADKPKAEKKAPEAAKIEVVANPYMFGGAAAAASGPVCCYRPILESTYAGGVWCLNCGRVVDLEQQWAYGTPSYISGPSYVAGPYLAGPSYISGPYYDSYYNRPSNYFSEEEPSWCTIM